LHFAPMHLLLSSRGLVLALDYRITTNSEPLGPGTEAQRILA
jgi:hypothetical protein